MSLPIVDPARTFYSQRIDGRPFVNCLPYSICPVLRWAGYDVPPDYGMQLRQASGVPVAPGRGTSYADMRRALVSILPDALAFGVVTFDAVSDAEMLNVLLPRAKRPNRGSVVSIICRMERLPRPLRRHVGYTWTGLHALTLWQRRQAPDGSYAVYLSDPMGRTYRGYSGEWVAWTDIVDALKRNDAGLIRCIHARRGTAR